MTVGELKNLLKDLNDFEEITVFNRVASYAHVEMISVDTWDEGYTITCQPLNYNESIRTY